MKGSQSASQSAVGYPPRQMCHINRGIKKDKNVINTLKLTTNLYEHFALIKSGRIYMKLKKKLVNMAYIEGFRVKT